MSDSVIKTGATLSSSSMNNAKPPERQGFVKQSTQTAFERKNSVLRKSIVGISGTTNGINSPSNQNQFGRQNSSWKKNLTIKVEEETITNSEFISTPSSEMQNLINHSRLTPSGPKISTPLTSATPSALLQPNFGEGGKYLFNPSVHPTTQDNLGLPTYSKKGSSFSHSGSMNTPGLGNTPFGGIRQHITMAENGFISAETGGMHKMLSHQVKKKATVINLETVGEGGPHGEGNHLIEQTDENDVSSIMDEEAAGRCQKFLHWIKHVAHNHHWLQYLLCMRPIRVESKFRTRWDILIIGLAMWNCVFLPINIAFDPPFLDSTFHTVLNRIIDIIFLIDLVINFRTTVKNTLTGEEIMSSKGIAMHYLKTRFLIDLIASIPLDSIIQSDQNISFQFRIVQIFKLSRILRFTKIISFLNATENVKLSLKLFKLIFYLIVYIHLQACAWFFYTKWDKTWFPIVDLIKEHHHFYEESFYSTYCFSVYHSVSILDGDDMVPATGHQAIVVSILVILSEFIHAHILGTIEVVLLALNRKTTKFQEQIEFATSTMKNMKIPDFLHKKIIEYITLKQNDMDAQEELDNLLSMISPNLRNQVTQHLFLNAIQSIPYFCQSSEVVEYIVFNIEALQFQAEDFVIKQGQKATHLYILAKGECDVLVKDQYKKDVYVSSFGPGNLFGEVALLFGTKRTSSVKCRENCTVGGLSAEAFSELIMYFPEIEQSLVEQTRKYKDHWKLFQINTLTGISYLKDLNYDIKEELHYKLVLENFEKGAKIFQRGQQCKQLYFIVSGSVNLIIERDGIEHELDVLHPGSTIGGYSIFNETQFYFTAKAIQNTSILILNREDLLFMAEHFDDLAFAIEGETDFIIDHDVPQCDYTLPQQVNTTQRSPHADTKDYKKIFQKCVRKVQVLNKAKEAKRSKIFDLIQTLTQKRGRLMHEDSSEITPQKEALSTQITGPLTKDSGTFSQQAINTFINTNITKQETKMDLRKGSILLSGTSQNVRPSRRQSITSQNIFHSMKSGFMSVIPEENSSKRSSMARGSVALGRESLTGLGTLISNASNQELKQVKSDINVVIKELRKLSSVVNGYKGEFNLIKSALNISRAQTISDDTTELDDLTPIRKRPSKLKTQMSGIQENDEEENSGSESDDEDLSSQENENNTSSISSRNNKALEKLNGSIERQNKKRQSRGNSSSQTKKKKKKSRAIKHHNKIEKITSTNREDIEVTDQKKKDLINTNEKLQKDNSLENLNLTDSDIQDQSSISGDESSMAKTQKVNRKSRKTIKQVTIAVQQESQNRSQQSPLINETQAQQLVSGQAPSDKIQDLVAKFLNKKISDSRLPTVSQTLDKVLSQNGNNASQEMGGSPQVFRQTDKPRPAPKFSESSKIMPVPSLLSSYSQVNQQTQQQQDQSKKAFSQDVMTLMASIKAKRDAQQLQNTQNSSDMVNSNINNSQMSRGNTTNMNSQRDQYQANQKQQLPSTFKKQHETQLHLAQGSMPYTYHVQNNHVQSILSDQEANMNMSPMKASFADLDNSQNANRSLQVIPQSSGGMHALRLQAQSPPINGKKDNESYSPSIRDRNVYQQQTVSTPKQQIPISYGSQVSQSVHIQANSNLNLLQQHPMNIEPQPDNSPMTNVHAKNNRSQPKPRFFSSNDTYKFTGIQGIGLGNNSPPNIQSPPPQAYNQHNQMVPNINHRSLETQYFKTENGGENLDMRESYLPHQQNMLLQQSLQSQNDLVGRGGLLTLHGPHSVIMKHPHQHNHDNTQTLHLGKNQIQEKSQRRSSIAARRNSKAIILNAEEEEEVNGMIEEEMLRLP